MKTCHWVKHKNVLVSKNVKKSKIKDRFFWGQYIWYICTSFTTAVLMQSLLVWRHSSVTYTKKFFKTASTKFFKDGNLVPRVFSLSNMAAASEKILGTRLQRWRFVRETWFSEQRNKKLWFTLTPGMNLQRLLNSYASLNLIR